MTAMQMATAKKMQTETMNSISPSTSGAKLDAESGYNGNCDCTVLVCSLMAQIRARCRSFAAAENQKSDGHGGERHDAAEAHDLQDRCTVLRRGWIVFKAIEQNSIHG